MKLIGTGLSPYVQRVLLAARHKDIPLELQAPEGGPRSPAHLAKNPAGKVPVLLDGELLLPESEVIVSYLEDRVPQPSLYPGDAAQRARARLLSRLLDTYGTPSFNAFLINDAPAIEVAIQRIDDSLRYLAHFWPDAQYAAGPEFSAADCALIPFFCIFERLPPRFGVADRVRAHPALAAWWKRTRETAPAIFAGETLDQAVRTLAPASTS